MPRRRFECEALEERLYLSGGTPAEPGVSASVPASVPIGESFTINLSFDNTHPTQAGFGPYIDLFLPRNGADGANGTSTPDGITFNSASFLGVPVTSTVLTFDVSGNATHPYAVDSSGNSIVVTGAPGDQLIVLQLPFGSFTSDQTPAQIGVSLSLSNLADLGTPLPIGFRGGFQFGCTAIADPATDPTLIGTLGTANVTPTLFTLEKANLELESETATGPNYPRTYTITLDLATGQTLQNVVIQDLLPSNIQYLGGLTVSPGGSTTVAEPLLGAPRNAPDNDLQVAFATLTGAAGNDVTITFQYFVPELDANGTPVINPATGQAVPSNNDVSAQANWTPIDGRDALQAITSDVTAIDDVLTDRALAIQKSAAVAVDVNAAGLSPGDTIGYTLNFQLSDFFTFDSLLVTDVLSDGQRFDATFTPTLAVTDRNGTVVGTFTVGATAVATLDTGAPGSTGQTTMVFNVSQALVDLGAVDGILQGGLADGGAFGAATGAITYRAVVQNQFSDTFPSGDPTVNQGDVLSNTVSIAGAVLDNATLAPTGGVVTDGSGAALDIARGSISKDILAINGVAPLGPSPQIAPGDEVTFRLRYSLPLASVEQFRLTDFLPLPVFAANELTTVVDVVSAALPAAGEVKFGAGDTYRAFSGIVPILTTDAVANSFTLNYGTFNPVTPQPREVELLFTVTVSGEPFADGLFLTNQVTAREGSTNAGVVSANSIVQVQLTEPELDITKGVVATNNGAATFTPGAVGPVSFNAPGSGTAFTGTISSTNLAATPINSNLAGIDADDLVTFALVVENTGLGLRGAFDVTLQDTIPVGFVAPGGGLNLRVTDGAGNALAFTGDLFAGGLTLTDPGPITGAIAPFDAANGANIVVIAYDLQAVANIAPSQTLINTGTLSNYAAIEGGTDFTATDLTDTAQVTTDAPNLGKVVLSTSLADTGSAQLNGARPDLAIGETVTFRLTLTIPEGTTPSAVLVDNLPVSGGILSVVGSTVVSIGANLTLGSGLGVGDNGVAADVQLVDGFADRVTFTLGNVTNVADGVENAADRITVDVTARVVNVAANANADALTNSATLTFTGGSVAATAAIDVVEPVLAVDKVPSKTIVSAGDLITYTVTLDHAAASNASAYDLSFTDLVNDPNLLFVNGSGMLVSGPAGTTIDSAAGSVIVTAPSFALGDVAIVFTYQAQVAPAVLTGASIGNTVSGGFSSLPGADANERSYTGSDTATLTAPVPTLAKSVTATSVLETASSQFNAANPDLVVGETVTFQMVFTLPEANINDVVLTDNLPTAAGILSLVSSRVVSLGANITGSTLAVNASGVGSDVNLVDGFLDRVVFDFGDLNNATDGITNAADQIVVEIVALVVDVPANVSGDVLTNTSVLAFTGAGGPATTAPATASIEVVEPLLTIDKAASVASGDAGDVVTFTVSIDHAVASTAAAFDVVLNDLLAPGYELVVGSVTSNLGAVTSGNSVGDTTVGVGVAVYALADPVLTVSYQARLANTVSSGAVLTNTAGLGYDSVPGAGGRAVSASDGASVTVTGLPSLAKGVVSSSVVETGSGEFDVTRPDLVVGETVTYQLTVTLAEGAVSGVVLTDDLPVAPGVLEVVSSRVVSIGGNVSGSLLAVNAAGVASDVNLVDGLNDRVVFNFGDLVNAGDNVSDANDRIVVEVVARVSDVAANASGDVLTNTGVLAFTTAAGAQTTAPATASIEVVEPLLTIDKVPGVPGALPGAPVTYTATIQHAAGSTATAFDIAITDLLGPLIVLQAGSVTATLGTIVTGNNPGDTSIRVELASYAPTDPTITITYTAVLPLDVPRAVNIDNTGILDYDSAPGAGGRAVNVTDTATIVSIPGLDKRVLPGSTTDATTQSGAFDTSVTDLAIGEAATYELVLRLAEGPTTIVVTDDLPFNPGRMELLGGSVVTLGASLSGSALAAGAPGVVSDRDGDGINDRITFDFGTIANAPNAVLDEGDEIVMQVRTRVVDAADTGAGDVLVNSATAAFVSPAGSGTLSGSAAIEVVEPVLEIAKTAAAEQPRGGDVVTYTLTVQHAANSTATAYDLVIGDALLANGRLVAGSVASTAGLIAVGNSAGDSQLEIRLDALRLDDAPVTITYQVRVNDRVDVGASVLNTAAVAFDTTAGPGGRTALAEVSFELPTLAFVYDAYHNFAAGDAGQDRAWSLPDLHRPLPPLLDIDPVYSGSADPGSTLTLTVYDARGHAIGTRTVVVDAGGNWHVSLPRAVIHADRDDGFARLSESRLFHDLHSGFGEPGLLGLREPRGAIEIGAAMDQSPHRLLLAQQDTEYVDAGSGGYNSRVYFLSTIHASHAARDVDSIAAAFRDRASEVVASLQQSSAEPFGFGWNKFNREFLVNSGVAHGAAAGGG